MSSKVVFKNVFYAILLQVIISAFGFITPGLIIYNYGSEMNGLVSSINQILRYFNLLEAGLSGAAVYELYRFIVKKDFESINKIVSYASVYYKKIGGLFIVGVLALAPVYTLFVVNTSLDNSIVFTLFIIFGFSGALEFFIMSRCRIIFTADQKGYIISIAMIVSTIIYQCISIALILNKASIISVYFISLFINVSRGIALNIIVKKVYENKISFKKHDKTFVIKSQKYVFLHEVFYIINNSLAILAINFLYDLKIASIYAIYNMPVIMINTILATIYQSITASYGILVAEQDIARENKVFNSFQFLYLCSSTWLLCTTAFLLTPFVNVYTSNISEMEYNFPLMGYMLMLFSIANCIRVVFGVPTSAHGLFKGTALSAVICSILSIIVSFSFGRLSAPFVILGPSVAFILNALYQMKYQRRVVNGFDNQSAIKSSLVLSLMVTLSSISSWKIEFVPKNWIEFFLYAFFSFLLIGILVVATFIATNRGEIKTHFSYITSIFFRNKNLGRKN